MRKFSLIVLSVWLFAVKGGLQKAFLSADALACWLILLALGVLLPWRGRSRRASFLSATSG